MKLKTNAKICLIAISIMAILVTVPIMSIAADDSGILVRARTVGIDKNTSKEIVIIDVTTNKTGQLKYIEWYYSKNESGKYNRDLRVLHFNDTIKNNIAILKIKRPLDPTGKPYSVVRALIYINDELALNSMFKSADIKQSTPQEQKKSPGFEIGILAIAIISMHYLLNKRRR